MSFAARANDYKKNGGAFVFPEGDYSARLKGWEFKLSKKKSPMFVLEFKVTDKGAFRGKILRDRTVISPKAEWQLDRLLAYLQDSGIDLNGLSDTDPEFQDIQDCLDYLESEAQNVKVHLTPDKDDTRYYNLKFLEVEKVAGGDATTRVTDPDDLDEGAPEGDQGEGQEPGQEPEEELPPPPPAPARRAPVAAPRAAAPAASPAARPAVPRPAPAAAAAPAAEGAARPARTPWKPGQPRG